MVSEFILCFDEAQESVQLPRYVKNFKEEYLPQLFRNIIQSVANHVGSPSKLTHLDTTKYHAKKIIVAMKAWHLVLEVEFVYHIPAQFPSGGLKVPIECKASLQVKQNHIRNILHYLKASGQRVGVLVSAAPVQIDPA